MVLSLAFTLVCIAFPSRSWSSYVNSNFMLEPYDFLFDTGVEAYYKGDYLSVILNMEKALRNRATVRRVKTNCRLKCASQNTFQDPVSRLGILIPGAGSVADLAFFWNIMKRADCVNSCETTKLGLPTLHQISEEVELEFEKRTPYNYLQVAYFKINNVNKAVAAANTFFQGNKNHVEMRQNLDYYGTMSGVQEDDFKDLESRTHMANFLMAKSYYSDNSFSLAAKLFEVAVDYYFAADEECRVLCEGSYNYDGYRYMEYNADLYQAMTDHFIQVLNCKQRCSAKLALISAGNDKPFEDFLPSHFNYLQFSYYNSESYDLAIECAKTYLLFHPDDEVMKQNLDFYSTMHGLEEAELLTARQTVKKFIQRSLLEKELMYFGSEAFGVTFIDPDSWTPGDIMPRKLRDKQKAEQETAVRITEEIGNLMKEIETLVEEKKRDSTDVENMVIGQEGGSLFYTNINLTMTSVELNGTQRILLDGVISEDECKELRHLSNAAALKSNGYEGHPSLHPTDETFQGLTILNALKLAQEAKVPLNGVHLFFGVSEKVRKILESYFLLSSPLFFSHLHLVCRTAIKEKNETPKTHHHSASDDNCLLVSELNECLKDPLAYTHQDYSAILYLNDDFEGGDFFFTELDAKAVTAVVRPQCGRVVGFGTRKENLHGVKDVRKGQRCAVVLWFTLNPVHEEKARKQVQHLLQSLSTPFLPDFDPKDELTDKRKLDGEANTYNIPQIAKIKTKKIKPIDIERKSKVGQLNKDKFNDAVKRDRKRIPGFQNGKDEL
ncbi:prolyl 3-hydroxylase 1 isoform X2 [Stigmatopora nigra]